MVPNKICRSQNFGDAGCLLDHYCEPGFHGGVPGSRGPAGPVRCSGAYRIKPSTGAIWVRPVAPQAESQGECFRGYWAPARSVTTGCHNPPENSSGSTNGTQRRPHGISQATLSRLRVGNIISGCSATKTKLAFSGVCFLCASPCPFSSRSQRFWRRDFSSSSVIRQRWRKRIDRRCLGLSFSPWRLELRGRVRLLSTTAFPLRIPAPYPAIRARSRKPIWPRGILTVRIPQGVSTRESITLGGGPLRYGRH